MLPGGFPVQHCQPMYYIITLKYMNICFIVEEEIEVQILTQCDKRGWDNWQIGESHD